MKRRLIILGMFAIVLMAMPVNADHCTYCIGQFPDGGCLEGQPEGHMACMFHQGLPPDEPPWCEEVGWCPNQFCPPVCNLKTPEKWRVASVRVTYTAVAQIAEVNRQRTTGFHPPR